MSKKAAGDKQDLALILERLEALEARLARLEGDARAAKGAAADFEVIPQAAVAASAPSTPAPPSQAPVASTAAPREDITEEILLVLSAAVAAFLGERAHIRQVRLLHSDAWAQQGRVAVMASHRWAVQR